MIGGDVYREMWHLQQIYVLPIACFQPGCNSEAA